MEVNFHVPYYLIYLYHCNYNYSRCDMLSKEKCRSLLILKSYTDTTATAANHV